MANSRFVYVTYIRTTPEKLWRALLEPEFIRQYWCGTSQECEWKAGSPWRIMIPDGRVAEETRLAAGPVGLARLPRLAVGPDGKPLPPTIQNVFEKAQGDQNNQAYALEKRGNELIFVIRSHGKSTQGPGDVVSRSDRRRRAAGPRDLACAAAAPSLARR